MWKAGPLALLACLAVVLHSTAHRVIDSPGVSSGNVEVAVGLSAVGSQKSYSGNMEMSSGVFRPGALSRDGLVSRSGNPRDAQGIFAVGTVLPHSRLLAQLSAAQAELNAKTNSSESVADAVVENFNLDSLGDPMGLVSCVPSCEEGSTCARVALPACEPPDPADNTAEVSCPPSSGPQNLTWVCQPCKEGEYCPANSLFTTNDGGRLDALKKTPDPLNVSSFCPAGSICPSPAERLDCPLGHFCPIGSKAPLPCAMPDLLNNNYSAKLVEPHGMLELALSTVFLGNYCPVNSSISTQSCKAGYYCPSPGKRIVCPEGYFCPPSASFPYRCRFLSYCPEGTVSPDVHALGFLAIVFGLVFYLIIHAIWHRFKAYLRTAEQHRQTLYSQLYTILNAQLDEKDQSEVRGIPPPDELLAISFDMLSLTLSTGQVALEGVTGEIQHSRLVAVMGPSGSGKSTFLNVLAGRASYGKVGGTVCVNGVVAQMSDYSSNIGFVPQDDIVYDDLTVRENLMYSAKLRQPPGTAPQKIRRVVSTAIRALQLGPVQNSLVGSVEKRGISGGQRKRVNVGMELVATPALLFLDEPTSGLDATASWDILYALKCLARLGMTIVTVIHQPRFSIFNLFDDLLLLGRGGRTVFLGPSYVAVPYFLSLGWRLPEGENPADFVLDIVAGTEINRKNAHMVNTVLPAEWEKAVKAKWVEGAQKSTPPPAQGAMRTHPPEMCTDAVDERRLTAFVINLLGEAQRERLLGMEDDDFHEEEEEEGAEEDQEENPGGKLANGEDGPRLRTNSSRPESPPLRTEGSRARASLGLMSADFPASTADLEILMDVYDLEPKQDVLDRILLRASAAFRTRDGTVNLGQLVRFLIADYQVHVSDLFQANRKMLSRQRTLLEGSSSSGRPGSAGQAIVRSERSRELASNSLQTTDDEQRGAMTWLFSKLGVALSVGGQHSESGAMVGMNSVRSSLEPPAVLASRPSRTQEASRPATSLSRDGPGKESSQKPTHAHRTADAVPQSRADMVSTEGADTVSTEGADTVSTEGAGDTSIKVISIETNEDSGGKVGEHEPKQARLVAFEGAEKSPTVPTAGELSRITSHISVRSTDGYESCESHESLLEFQFYDALEVAPVAPGGQPGTGDPVPAGPPEDTRALEAWLSEAAAVEVPDALGQPVDEHGFSKPPTPPGSLGGGRDAPGAPGGTPLQQGANSGTLDGPQSYVGEAAEEPGASARGVPGVPHGVPSSTRAVPGGAQGPGSLGAAEAASGEPGPGEGGDAGEPLERVSQEVPPARGPTSARERWGRAVRLATEESAPNAEMRSPFESLANADDGDDFPRQSFKGWGSIGGRTVKFGKSLMSSSGTAAAQGSDACSPLPEGLHDASGSRGESFFSIGVRTFTSMLQWLVLPFIACTTSVDKLLARAWGWRRRGRGTSRLPPGSIQQFRYVTARAFVQWHRHLNEFFMDMFLNIIVAYLLGQLLTRKMNPGQTPLTLMTHQLAFALLTASGSLKVFSRHRIVFLREASTGLRPLPYFLGHVLVDLINVLLRPLAFSATLNIAFQRFAPYRPFYISTLMTSWWVSTLGYAISILFSGTQALMMLIMAILIFGVLVGGVRSPTLVTMNTGMPIAWAFSMLSYTRWVVEPTAILEFAAWPSSFHHLALIRLLAIGYCGNSQYGVPELPVLVETFQNVTTVRSYDEALDAARVNLGDPVVDMLQCTLDTRVTKSSDIDCIDLVCGKYVVFNWLVMLAIGFGFSLIAYIGLVRMISTVWSKIRFFISQFIERFFLKWMRPVMLKTRDVLVRGLHWLFKALRAEHLMPARLRAHLDEKEKTRLVAEMLFMNKMRRPNRLASRPRAGASVVRDKGASIRHPNRATGHSGPPQIVVESPAPAAPPKS